MVAQTTAAPEAPTIEAETTGPPEAPRIELEKAKEKVDVGAAPPNRLEFAQGSPVHVEGQVGSEQQRHSKRREAEKDPGI